jgi:hypothetical protein
MMIAKTAIPFKLAITDETPTPLAGLALFGEFLKTTGLEREFGAAFPVPGSARGYSAWEHLHPLLLMLHGGGRALEDLRKISEDRRLICGRFHERITTREESCGPWIK